MKLQIKLLSILFFYSYLFYTAHAETYCIDGELGDDSNTGVCSAGVTDQAWSTVAKVSSKRFLPGDIIEFKRGGIWDEKLTIKSYSGADIADAPVIFRAWGVESDPLPIIDGSSTGESLALRSYRSYIEIRDIHFKSDSVGMALSATGGNDSVLLDGIKVEMDPTNSTKGILFSKGGVYIRIRNLEITGARNLGINFAGHVTNKISDVVVENSDISGAGSSFAGNDGISIHENSEGGTAGALFVFRDNVVENFPEQGFDITSGTNVTLLRNITRNNGRGAITVGHSASVVTIDEHESYNEPALNTAAAINISSSDVTVKNSIITGSSGYHMLNIYNGNDGTDADNVKIINNTFVWDRSSTLFTIGEIVDLTIENNIFITARQDFGPCVLDFVDSATTPASQGLTINFNQYYSPSADICFKDDSGSNPIYYSFDAFRTAFSHETNGLLSNPELVNLDITSPNYHTTTSSTAIDAGNPLSAFNLEPENNGKRINIGRYGNTVEATIGNDTDADGLTDQNEWCFNGDCSNYLPYPLGTDLDINNEDTDGDGFRDGTEVSESSDPLDINSIPTILPDGDINLDGQLNAADFILAQRSALGLNTLSTEQIAHGDFRPLPAGDDLITTADLLLIIKLIMN